MMLLCDVVFKRHLVVVHRSLSFHVTLKRAVAKPDARLHRPPDELDTQYPLHPSLRLSPDPIPVVRIDEQQRHKNPNVSSLSIEPQLLHVRLPDMESPFCISADGRRTTLERRSLFLQFSLSFFFFWAKRDNLQERTGLVGKDKCPFLVSAFLIDDLVYGCLLVPWSGDNVLVVHGYITAQHRGRLFRLEMRQKKERKYWKQARSK